MFEKFGASFGLNQADFIAACGVLVSMVSILVAVLAWRFPPKPKPDEDEVREVLTPISTPLDEPPNPPHGREEIPASPPKDAQLEGPSEIELPFPPGLRILDYDPGVRLTLRECGRATVQPSVLLPRLGLSLGLSFIVGATVHAVLAVPMLVLLCAMSFRSSRRGARVHLNLQKRMFFVSRGNSSSGGGWPPEVDRGVKQEGKSDKWLISLYLAGVCIWTAETGTPAAGKAKIRSFENALRQICAQPQPSSVSQWDRLIELIFYA
ncbi:MULTISPECIES: hypothetical protein [unclassified Bradyrhizobium]|uniref:hypothetical protein n=1 Tax=unclassified Bradyrhizobium TaxID=2631580 RepID=UPI001CD6E040|nr:MULTISPECIES: hypothetical protein [unclassified Bradyrhizobium]MCA1428881.1 hypothetical protein [Bradyrhizobium sp. NBAIM16]MCA1503753.1 hypothetical protein [Bradyrhizobium sp. NBAIM02]MCA1514586.1 hypothetical protein [Bradyrhizobium sp. NBAIM01]